MIKCWMKVARTRAAQLVKYRDIWARLEEWHGTLPAYLDWTKYNSTLTSRVYLRMQRPYLETQFQCLKMKVSWSIAHLDPLLMVKFQLIWDIKDAYATTLKAAQCVLKIIDENGAPSDAFRFYHWEGIRTTMTLLQMLHRNDIIEGTTMDEVIESCQQGIKLCRKLIPSLLATMEEVIETTFKQ